MSGAGVSSANDDEIPASVDDLASELGREIGPDETALVHGPARSVLEHPLLPALRLVTTAEHRADDDELARYATRLGEEGSSLGLFEVAVEVAREQALERLVRERQVECVASDELGSGRLPAGDLEHPRARIEPDHLSAEVPSQEAGSAGHVERAQRWQRGDRRGQFFEVAFPARPISICIQSTPEPPVIVFVGARVVVRLHRS
jgi:hypothetical protein